MSKSKRLKIRDLRGLNVLLGECCELGADPTAWRQHLTEQLPSLLRCQMSMCQEFRIVARPFEELFWLRPLHAADHGWATLSDRKPLEEHISTGRPEDGPHVTPDLLDHQIKTVHWTGITRFGVRSCGELLARCREFWPVLAAGRESDGCGGDHCRRI